MSQPGHATDWQSACIPPTIRRPWNVWENFLEDHVAEASSQAEEVTPEIRDQIASVQAKGAKMAFLLLDESVQQQYIEVSYQELAAFANWRRSQVAQQESGAVPPATEFEGCWDLLNHDDKKEWLPQDPKAFLAADLQWAALVTNPLSGQEAKKPFKGEKDQSKKVPVKAEVKKTAVVSEAKVKEEPGSSADPKQGAPAKEKTVVVKKEIKQTATAQPPQKVQQQEAPKEKAKPVQKQEAPKEKAVVVKQEPKQVAPAKPPQKIQQQEAPKEKANPVSKQEAPKEKAVVVKQERKQSASVQPPRKDQQQQEAPKDKAKPLQTPDVAKEKAVEVKKEPLQTGHAKPQNQRVEKASSKEKAVKATADSTAMVAAQPCADKEVPSKEKAVRAKKTKEAAEPAKRQAKAKAKSGPVSLEQRLRKKKKAASDDEAEDDKLMALVPRSDDEDADEADAPPEISKPRSRGKDAARSAPPGRMLVNRQYRAPPKEVAENLFPEALEASCCKCHGGSVSADNDLGMCDRCDKAFHQKCHDPVVTYFGNPEDQWFCAQCTLDLAEMRKLQLKVEDFCWVQATGETVAWPARVLRIDFSSLADPKPYWVQFFDAGPPEGAWVGEIHVKPWSDGPSFRSIVQARRRNAVRLAEADGAPQISTEERAPASRRKRPAQEDPENPNPSRRRAVAEDSPENRPRRSRRGEANVSLLTEPTAKRRARARSPDCLESPKPKRRQDVDPVSTEKQPREKQAQSKIDETFNLIAQLKEQQRQVDQELAQQEAAA
eukprot:s1152_g19.t1